LVIPDVSKLNKPNKNLKTRLNIDLTTILVVAFLPYQVYCHDLMSRASFIKTGYGTINKVDSNKSYKANKYFLV
jgi:hypothetical protein